MPLTFEFCLPTVGMTVLVGSDWLHEIKFDGYRLRVERNSDRVRLITRGGYDWTKRYPWIVEAALKNRQKHMSNRIKTVPSLVFAMLLASVVSKAIPCVAAPRAHLR